MSVIAKEADRSARLTPHTGDMRGVGYVTTPQLGCVGRRRSARVSSLLGGGRGRARRSGEAACRRSVVRAPRCPAVAPNPHGARRPAPCLLVPPPRSRRVGGPSSCGRARVPTCRRADVSSYGAGPRTDVSSYGRARRKDAGRVARHPVAVRESPARRTRSWSLSVWDAPQPRWPGRVAKGVVTPADRPVNPPRHLAALGRSHPRSPAAIARKYPLFCWPASYLTAT